MERKEGGREQHVMEGSQSRAMETVDSGRRFQWEKWISHVAGPVPFLALELQGSGSRWRFRRNWWAKKKLSNRDALHGDLGGLPGVLLHQ